MRQLTKTLLCFSILFLSSAMVFAQRGDVTGVILDSESNELLVGVTVSSSTTRGGGYSDENGVFRANFAAGTQTITIDYIGYKTKTIENVVVVDGGVTDLGNVLIESNTATVDGFTFRVKGIKNSDNALIKMEQKSAGVISTVSSETMKKAGVSNAAGAAGKVTGVSIEGGKYVFVRGLGDRYTKTVLNGMELPGLDPDKNTVQMDIFPTNLIDNIIVKKSFTPNLSGDFTGGWVDLSREQCSCI